MNFILPLLYFILFTCILYRHPFFKKTQLPFWILAGIFILKIISSGIMYWIYTNYYPVRIEADIFKYFDDAKIIYSSLEHSVSHFFKLLFYDTNSHPELDTYYNALSFWKREIDYGLGNDNRTIIKINALIMLFSFGNIWVHNVCAGFISIFSYILLYKTIRSFNPKLNYFLFISIVLIPSGFFWTSAMLKETIVMLGLACYVYGFITAIKNHKHVWAWISLIFGIYILLHIKIYVLAALLPASLAYFVAHKITQKRVIYMYLITILIIVIGIIINNTYLHAIPILETFAHKRNDFIMDAAYYAHAQSYIPIGMLGTDIMSFIKETPFALYRATFLPWIFNSNSMIAIIPALENFLLLILIILACFFHRKTTRYEQNIIWFSCFFSITLLWIIGITTPVVGAIVRYKIPIFPFLYSIFVLIIDWQKIRFVRTNENKII
ncbi:MAG: hypothetical protein R6U95_05675 [Bacteroidales bacterium]